MNFSDVEKLQFAEPYWLLLLLLIPILLWFQSLKSNKSPSIRFSSLQNILNIRLTGKGRYLWIPSLLRFLTIISLIITIARPQLDQSTEFIFLRDFYTERAEQYFDGDLQYGRADDFIDELLQTKPMVVGNTGASTQNLVDPVRAAEEIIQMRKIVAQDWKAMMSRVSEEHTGIRQALLTNTFSNDAPISSTFDDSTGFQ